MLRLIPPPLHRLLLRAAHGLRKRWWRWCRPRLEGCSVIAFDPRGQVLLVRHSYGHAGWALPGGAVGRGEDPAAAAGRELFEEVRCRLSEMRAVAIVPEILHGAENIVHLFAGVTEDTPRGDGREIMEVCFFPLDALPEQLNRTVPARLGLLWRLEGGLSKQG